MNAAAELGGSSAQAGDTLDSPGCSVHTSDSSTNATGPVLYSCVSENMSSLGFPSPLNPVRFDSYKDATEDILSHPCRFLQSHSSVPKATTPDKRRLNAVHSPKGAVTANQMSTGRDMSIEHSNADFFSASTALPSANAITSPRSTTGRGTTAAQMRTSGAASLQSSFDKGARREVEQHDHQKPPSKCMFTDSPIEFVSIQPQVSDFDGEAVLPNEDEEISLHTPPRPRAHANDRCSPGTPRLSDEGSVKTNDTFGSTVAEQIEVLQRDIEESNGRIKVTKQKVEDQQALLERRQLSVKINSPSNCYSRTLGGSETSSVPTTPSPLRNCSLRQAQSSTIADAHNASQSVLHQLSHPQKIVFNKGYETEIVSL